MITRHRMLAVAGIAAAFLGATTFGFRTSSPTSPPAAVAAGPDVAVGLGRAAGGSLDRTIADLRARVAKFPRDYVSWSTLGLAYVQQASVTADSGLYPVAEAALQKSLAVNDDDNFLAYGGLSALANARHDFAAAKAFATRGLAINGANPILLGALGDAETQLGTYGPAFATIQRMVDRSPDTASLARASYAWELRGDVARARALMQRALDDAPDASARSFALVHLGELAFDNGDAGAALAHFRSALEASPVSTAALAGKARAEAALGQTLTAVDDYNALVQRVPDPGSVIELGELLESVGRTDEAQRQYAVVGVIEQLRRSNGVAPDASGVVFLADHGDPGQALAEAERAVAARPFLTMHDAHAWALHRNGRDREALAASNRALATGVRSAGFRFHRAMIELAMGDTAATRADLTKALAINPSFNPLQAPTAVETLARLVRGGDARGWGDVRSSVARYRNR